MKRKNSNVSQMKVFKQFITQSFIELEEFLYKMPLSLECILLVIGSIQKTTFFMHTENFNTFNQLPYFISMICNPAYFIQHIKNTTLEIYCFVIVLILLLLYFYSYFSLYKQEVLVKKGNIFNISCIVKYNLIERSLFYYSAYFSQLFLTILIFPLSQLLSISFQAAIKDTNPFKYLTTTLCIIELILLLGLALFKSLISLESSNIVPLGFNLLLVTNYQAIQYCIMMFQICASFFSLDEYQFLQAFACLLAALLKIMELFFHYTQPNLRKVKAIILALTFCFIIGLINIFKTIFGGSTEEYCVLFIIIQPLFYKVIIFYYEDTRFLTLFKIQSNAHPKVQQFQLNLLLTEFKGSYINPLIVRAMLLHQHISDCDEIQCFCRKIVSITHVPKYAQAMLPEHEIQLILRLSQNFLHSLRLLKTKDQAVYYIHYISLINNLGQSSQAYNQIGLIMGGKAYKERKIKKKQTQALVALGLYKENSDASQVSYFDVEQDDQKKIQKVALSGIYKIKILILKQRAKSCIRQYLVIQNDSQDELSDSVQRFMKTEEANVKLKQRILRVVVMKIAFLKMINQEEEMEKGTSIYLNTFKLIRKMVKLNDFIEQLYLQFPSSSIQSVYSFYSAEIMNDYLQAFNIINTGGVSDDKVKEKSKKVAFDLLNSKSTYVNLAIDDSTYDLKIIGASKNAHNFFGFNLDEFAKVTSPSAIIPACVWLTHNNIVKNFFNTGKSKYFRQTALAFAHVKSGALKQIDAFYDIDFKKESFVAQLFLFESLSDSAYLVAGMNNAVSGITENILNQLQFKDTQINKVFKILSQIQINYFIPQWKFIIQKFNSEQKDNLTKSTKQIGTIESVREIQTFFDMEFNFINEKRLKQLISKHSNLVTLTENVLEDWKFKQNLHIYSASLTVNKQTVDNVYYYIVQVDDLKLINHHYQTLQTQLQSNNNVIEDHTSSNQYIQRNIEIKDESPLDEMALLLKQFDLSQCDISQEELPNPPNIAQNIGYDLSQDIEDLKFGVKLQPLQQFTNRQMVSSRVDKQLINSILSPHISQSKPLIIEQNSISNIKFNQQRFFQDHEDISIQPSFENFKRSENENNFNQFKIDPDVQVESFQFKDQKKLSNYQNHENNKQYEASSISSAAGLRNSRFFKKYSNLHQYYLQDSQSQYFEIFLKSIITSLFVSVTFILIQFIIFPTSSNNLLVMLDTLSIQQSIMGPMDSIILAAESVNQYNNLIQQYPDKEEFFKNLQNFSLISLPIIESLFQQNYRRQLESAQMSFLLQENNFYPIQNINITNLTQQNLSVTNILNIMSMNGNDFYKQFTKNITQDIWSMKQFQFFLVNFDIFNDIFDFLKEKTIQLSNINVDQWDYDEDIIFFVLLSFSIFGCAFSLLFNLLHRYRIEEFLQLFQKIDQNHLKKDQERFKMINKLLTRDIDVMFKYRFELTDKEKTILQYEKDQEFGQKTKENKKQSIKPVKNNKGFTVSKSLAIIYSVITCGVCIGVLTFMHVQIEYYLKGFKVSAEIHSKISDLSANIPESFIVREIAYNTQNPNFPNNSFEEHIYYEEFIRENSISQIEVLVSLLSNINSYLSNSLATPEFINFFEYINENDIYDILGQSTKAAALYFCQKSFDGTLQRGLIQSINTVKQTLQNEFQINNFTIQPQNKPFGQNEALILLLDIFVTISTQFQSTINSQTLAYQKILYICGSLFLVYVTLQVLFLKLYYYDLNLREYRIIKKCYILMPSMSLLIDLQLERKLRLLYWQEKS